MNWQGRRVVREPQLLEIIQVSKSTRYRLEKGGKFPKKVRLSPNTVGWFMDDVQNWLEQRAMESK